MSNNIIFPLTFSFDTTNWLNTFNIRLETRYQRLFRL